MLHFSSVFDMTFDFGLNLRLEVGGGDEKEKETNKQKKLCVHSQKFLVDKLLLLLLLL